MSFQIHEKVIPTLIPHAKFGAPQCRGYLYGRTVMKTAGIVCNKCLEIIRLVRPGNLQRLMDEMELQLEVASALCHHCGAASLFPGFSHVDAFVCRECVTGNG